MDAPDKIYISPLMISSAEILDKRVTPDDVVYIRKDLLLEWADAMKILCEEHPACEYGNWHDGNANAYGKLISKLNSL